jgi:hypothetical protein
MKIALFATLICIAESYQTCYNIATCDQMPNAKCFCSYNCSNGCVMLSFYYGEICVNDTYSIPKLTTFSPHPSFSGINQTTDSINCPFDAYITKLHIIPVCTGIVADICINKGSPAYPGGYNSILYPSIYASKYNDIMCRYTYTPGFIQCSKIATVCCEM